MPSNRSIPPDVGASGPGAKGAADLIARVVPGHRVIYDARKLQPGEKPREPYDAKANGVSLSTPKGVSTREAVR